MFIPEAALIGTQSFVPLTKGRRGRRPLSSEERISRKEVGKLLKRLRRERFLTQVQCSDSIGLTGPACIAMLESGNWYNQEVVDRYIRYLSSVQKEV